MPQGRWVVVDVTTGHTVEVEGPPFDAAYLSPVTWGEIWWDPSGEAVYWVRHARDRRSAELVEIDPRTGWARTVIKECGPTRVDVNRHFYDPPVVAVLRRRGEVLWFSRRDGEDFHDHSYGNLASAGELRDHVAAIGQLGETRPWMDLARVGIVGHSAGGFAATKAVLRHPETFSVAVAEAGNHDNRIYNASWAEAFDGPVDPERYSATSNVEEVMELSARLLLIHGGMDDNVMPDHTLRLVDRLIAADQDFDMLIVPRAEHSFHGYQHYVLRKRWDYLVRHLLCGEPPSGYRLDPVPLSSRLFEHLFDGGGGRAHA